MVGAIFFEGSCACGTVPSPAPFFGRHWCAPAGLFVSSHSKPNRFSKKLLPHLGRRSGPGHFEAAGDGVRAFARAKVVLPAKALLLESAASGSDPTFSTGPRRGFCQRCDRPRSAPRFLRRSSPCDRTCRGYPWRGDRIGLAIRPFGVHVDQAHLHGGERILEIARVRHLAVVIFHQHAVRLFHARRSLRVADVAAEPFVSRPQ